MEELRTLANEVEMVQGLTNFDSRKRKRMSIDDSMNHRRNPLSKQGSNLDDPVSPKSTKPATLRRGATPEHTDTPHLATPTDELSLHDSEPAGPVLERQPPLEGLKVIIIHVKERLEDGPPVGDAILQQLQEYEQEYNLGCEFTVSASGMSFYF
jgi:hypothetical protein